MFGIYISGIYFGFTCQPQLQVVYTCIIIVLSTLATVAISSPRLAAPEYHMLRVGVLIFTVCFAVVPVLHWWTVAPAAMLARGLNGILLMLLSYAIGFFFYSTRFPESRFPGKFDIWFHSHQWWHVLVFVGALNFERTLVAMCDLMVEEGQLCGVSTSPLPPSMA